MSSQIEGPVVKLISLPRRRFLLEWIAVHLLIGVFYAGLITLFDDSLLAILTVGGVLLGFSQRLILGRHLPKELTRFWTLSTSAAWLAAMCFFAFCSFAVIGGSGINSVPEAQTRTSFVCLCLFSGAIFGGLQWLGSPSFAWVMLQVIAWILGLLTGAYVTATLSGANFLPHLAFLDAFDAVLGTSIWAGLTVYSLILGTGIAWSFPQIRLLRS